MHRLALGVHGHDLHAERRAEGGGPRAEFGPIKELGPGYISGYRSVMRTVPLSEAKDKLSGLVEDVDTTHEIITITRHGRPAAVLMSADDLDSLRETLHWLSAPGIRESLAEAEAAIEVGETVGSAELRRQLGLPED